MTANVLYRTLAAAQPVEMEMHGINIIDNGLFQTVEIGVGPTQIQTSGVLLIGKRSI